MNIPELVLNILFPRRCVGCGKIGRYFCIRCKAKLEIIPPFCIVCKRHSFDGATHPICKSPRMIDGVFALTYYKGTMKRAIRLLKYHSVTDLVAELSSLLVSFYPKHLPKFDYFVPVPLYWKRERMRGYNQAELLAIGLGRGLSIKVDSSILLRIQYSKPQVDLRGDERRKNIIGAFSYNSSFTISNKNVGLIDDVSTTGATLTECGKVLKANGANKVWAIVLAHGS